MNSIALKVRYFIVTTTAVVALLLLGSPIFSFVQATSSSVSFGSIQNLSNNSGASTAPVVSTVFNNGHQYVYVAWEDTSSVSRRTTFFQVSSDGGSTWLSNPTEFTGLSGAANPQLDAVQIAASGSYVYLTWKQGGGTAYAASADNGASFTWGLLSAGTAPGQNGIALTGKMTAQAAATNGTSAYFTWFDAVNGGYPTGTDAIMFVATYDGGATFTSPVPINTGDSALTFAREDEVTAVGNYVYVTWDIIWFSASFKGGEPGTWSTPVNLLPVTCVYPCIGREPMISASGTNVYVTFPMGGHLGTSPYSTRIAVSHDHGQDWLNANASGTQPTCVPLPRSSDCNPAHDLSSSTLSNTREVQVASYGSDVFVTSRGTANGVKGTQQYVYVSTDSGNTFSAPILVAGSAQSGGEMGFGSVVFDQSNGNAYAYWPHGTTSQLFSASSQDSGLTWATQQVSSSTGGVVAMGDPGGGQGPMAAASNGHVYLVWEDTSTGNGDIYFVASS